MTWAALAAAPSSTYIASTTKQATRSPGTGACADGRSNAVTLFEFAVGQLYTHASSGGCGLLAQAVRAASPAARQCRAGIRISARRAASSASNNMGRASACSSASAVTSSEPVLSEGPADPVDLSRMVTVPRNPHSTSDAPHSTPQNTHSQRPSCDGSIAAAYCRGGVASVGSDHHYLSWWVSTRVCVQGTKHYSCVVSAHQADIVARSIIKRPRVHGGQFASSSRTSRGMPAVAILSVRLVIVVVQPHGIIHAAGRHWTPACAMHTLRLHAHPHKLHAAAAARVVARPLPAAARRRGAAVQQLRHAGRHAQRRAAQDAGHLQQAAQTRACSTLAPKQLPPLRRVVAAIPHPRRQVRGHGTPKRALSGAEQQQLVARQQLPQRTAARPQLHNHTAQPWRRRRRRVCLTAAVATAELAPAAALLAWIRPYTPDESAHEPTRSGARQPVTPLDAHQHAVQHGAIGLRCLGRCALDEACRALVRRHSCDIVAGCVTTTWLPPALFGSVG
eukprot:363053-Chlamydomonas_euryale.AAC.6